MKKRIIYGIGGTGSAVVDKLKSIGDKEFNDVTIYKVWDIDNDAISNLKTLDKNEKKIFFKDNIRKKIKTIKEDRYNNPSLYDKVFDVFPIDDERQINFLPTTEGIGAAKQPIVSRLVGTILEDDIRETVNSDCELADDGNAKNAYLVLSACGGTSSGLNIQVYIELIRQGFNVYLFFVSPNYFNEVAPDPRDKSVHAANTVATFLRIFYDLEKKKIIYADEDGLDISSKIYPFIIESEWSSGRKRAEFIHNPGKHNSSEDFFYMYNALAILSFLRVNTNRPQPFISSYMNDLEFIERKKAYFNMLLLYPVNNTRDRVKEAIRNQLSTSNGKSGKDNLQHLLSIDPEYELLVNAHNVLSILKSKVEHIDSEYTIKDIYNILSLVKRYLEDNKTQKKWKPSKTANDPFSFQDDSSKKNRKKKKFLGFDWGFKKSSDFKDDDSEIIVVDNHQLDKNQKNAVIELLDYVNEKLNKYEKNFICLTDNAELPFNPINFDSVGTSELNIDLAKFFTNDFQIDEIVKKSYEESFLTKIDTPPSLSQWHEQHKIYSYNEIIDGNHYLLKIHTEIRDHALQYLRGESIKNFTRRRKEKILCYPDKRLNGIFPPDDEVFKDFLIWEEEAVKTLFPIDAVVSLVDEMDIALLALALISDSIDKTEMPKKILDINKNGKNYYIKALINIDSPKETEILGKETPDWYEAAQEFEITINEINVDDPFETKVLDEVKISDLINSSHNQVLEYCLGKKNNSCLTETYNKLNVLKSSLPRIENDKIEKVNEMIDDLNIYLTQLAIEYKKRVAESDIIIPDIHVND